VEPPLDCGGTRTEALVTRMARIVPGGYVSRLDGAAMAGA
jgi:hypothetical protein